jgi:hypothetical protein
MFAQDFVNFMSLSPTVYKAVQATVKQRMMEFVIRCDIPFFKDFDSDTLSKRSTVLDLTPIIPAGTAVFSIGDYGTNSACTTQSKDAKGSEPTQPTFTRFER